ncbi:MAG: hypothetical protein KAS39_06415 [Actinomycetia bacterium]|nr:hypothetical protein [Actinomycetes bacterium]
MPESKVRKLILEFFEELSLNLVEERVINYTLKELQNGKRLRNIIEDPYVKNRIPEEKISHIIENPQIIEAVEEEINKTFKKDFNFFEQAK